MIELAEGMRFELTVGVDPLQRFSKPLTVSQKMAILLKSLIESAREMREHDVNTHTILTQEVTQIEAVVRVA